MIKNTLLLTSFLASFLLFSAPILAQGHDVYCDKAESTASIQVCLKRHLASAQKRLNTIYQELSSKKEGEDSEALAELQKQWLAYRDAECAWEVAQTETPALKRTNELSCMARVTEDRADILATALMDGAELSEPKEYGSFPRWMNVVAKGKSKVFWDYHNRMSADLNCDGEQEKLIWGVSLTPVEIVEATQGQGHTYNTAVTIAIADNPLIGKPSVQYIEMPVLGAEGQDTLCDHEVRLKVIEANESEKEPLVEGDLTKEPLCQTKLEVNQKKCSAKSILWTGKTYALEIKEEVQLEVEKEKNE